MHFTRAFYLVSALAEFASEVPYLSYLLFRHLGLGYVFLYTAINTLVFGILDYPTGGVADRYGRRRVFALGMALVGCNYLVVSLNASATSVVLAGFLAGIGSALRSGSLDAWIVDKLDEIGMKGEMDRIFGRQNAFALVADVLAGVLGSSITFLGGYWWTIPTAGIVALVASCITLVSMSENWGRGKGTKYVGLLKEGMGWIFNKKSLLILGLAQTFFMIGAHSYWEVLIPLYSERGIPDMYFGLIGTAMHLPAIITSAYVHRLTRRIGVAKFTLMLSWAWTAFCTLMIFLATPGSTIFLATILESLFATRWPAIGVWQNELIPSDMRATVLSGLSTMRNIGESFVLFALSPFVQTKGTSWGLLAAIMLISMANCILFFSKENDASKAPQTL
jgi:MFS family permease